MTKHEFLTPDEFFEMRKNVKRLIRFNDEAQLIEVMQTYLRFQQTLIKDNVRLMADIEAHKEKITELRHKLKELRGAENEF